MNFHKQFNDQETMARRIWRNALTSLGTGNSTLGEAEGRGRQCDCPQSPALCLRHARRAVGVNSPYRSQLAVWTYCTVLFLAAHCCIAQELSPLAKAPDWSRLEIFQETMTHDDFARLLNDVYAPDGVWKATIVVLDDKALIAEDAAWSKMFTLRFAKVDTNGKTKAKHAPHYWHAASTLPAAPKKKPLEDVTIALDPGHLGGKWARMEERWYVIGDSKPVAEGDMTLITAKLLAKRLRALGATVVYVRSKAGPVTDARPAQLHKEGLEELKKGKNLFTRDNYDGPDDPAKENSVQWHAEKLFYRVSEIHARGKLVNGTLRPDLTLCMHYNAEPWGDETKATFSDKNHMHLIINGSYMQSELALDDVRFEMLFKLLTRSYPVELAISKKVAASMAGETGLPAYAYSQPDRSVHPVPGEPYLWLRNLLANRLYRNPTIYIEPFVMNNQLVFDRVQASDYEGQREIDGAMRKSIYREYADAVADGLAAYFREARK